MAKFGKCEEILIENGYELFIEGESFPTWKPVKNPKYERSFFKK